MDRTRLASLALVSLAALAGCDNPPAEPTPDAAVEPDDAYVVPDAGPPPSAICDELGLTTTEFKNGDGDWLGETAGDFTVQTTTGPWNFQERWSGCESYVFFTYFPDLRSSPSGDWDGDVIFRSLPEGSLVAGPRNVHYFFMSYEADPADRLARMGSLALDLEDVLAAHVDASLQASWREHFHFVTDRAQDVPGSVGDYMTAYLAYMSSDESIVDLGDRGQAGAPVPFVFGIDRAQQFDAGEILDPYVGGAPYFGMARYLPDFYNYRFDLEQRLAGESATVVPLIDDETTTQRVFVRTVDLPSASELPTDTLELDVVVDCRAGNPYACSEWDRIATVGYCVDGEACTDLREITRWITPYWRRGRQHYAIDATPFLPLLAEGGSQSFRVELGPDWERATEWTVRVAFRFRNTGTGARPSTAIRAFTGGTFDATYNTREPFSFDVPATATRVELVTILSGHGQTSGNNCAEWCDHRHQFAVNGTDLDVIRYTGAIGGTTGCAAHAVDGVIPGQLGNWAPERAYWCPGMPVEANRVDITSLVNAGETNALTYSGSFRTGDPAGGDIALSAYVVFYE